MNFEPADKEIEEIKTYDHEDTLNYMPVLVEVEK